MRKIDFSFTVALSIALTGVRAVSAQETVSAEVKPAAVMLNSEVPLTDAYLMQSLKPVIRQLKGQVTVNKQLKEEASPVANAAAPETMIVIPQAPVAVAPVVVPIAPAVAAPVVPVAPVSATPSSDRFTQRLTELDSIAAGKNEELQKYVAAVDKYASFKRRLMERSHDMLNYAVLFKGVSPSSEAGDVILSEKSKLKSLAAAKFMKQKLSDNLELRTTSALMQIAMGIGNPNREEGETQASEAVTELAELVGKDEADKTVATLNQLSHEDATAVPMLVKPLWTVSEAKHRVDEVVASAVVTDPVVQDIREEVHHFNQHADGTLAAHRVARTTLSLASMTPNFVGPAAQVILFSYLTATGGTEQEKILRELYIDKRMSSRANLLNEEAHMAIHNYQIGALTQNRLLMTCSQSLVKQLVGAETAGKLLSAR
jgi:hypothetical protein